MRSTNHQSPDMLTELSNSAETMYAKSDELQVSNTSLQLECPGTQREVDLVKTTRLRERRKQNGRIVLAEFEQQKRESGGNWPVCWCQKCSARVRLMSEEHTVSSSPEQGRYSQRKRSQNGMYSKTYKHLRNTRHFPLPGLSTLKRWISASRCRPIFHSSLWIFWNTNKTDSLLILCESSFDEMFVSQRLYYGRPWSFFKMFICKYVFSSCSVRHL
jgi:hypothetical protein